MPDKQPPLRSRVGATKGIPGPSIREGGGTLPCGCAIGHDDDNKMRFFYCAPHAVAYEMLEALQESLALLDDIANNPPSPQYDVAPAMETAMKARKIVRKAKGSWG